MKKIFLFAAAVAATMALNAASFTGFDFRDGSLGTKIHDEGLLNTAVNVTLNETDATDHKYEIKNTEAGEMGFEIGGVEFSYSDQQAGHGGLYGLNSRDYSEYVIRGHYIDVLKLVQEYRRKVNPKVNVFSVQTAG